MDTHLFSFTQTHTHAAIAPNPNARRHVLQIGAEKTRVILIDDAIESIYAVRQLACEQTYTTETHTYYPGVRARCPDLLREAIIAASADIIRQAYHLPPQQTFSDQGSWLSIANTPPETLDPLQQLPHFDSHSQRDFAVMLYTNEQDFQGTGFYRHRPTGYENITAARWPTFKASRDAADAIHRGSESLCETKSTGYFSDSTDEFERLGKIDYRANRLVIYPGTLLHSGLIDPTRDLSANPATGRLTVNVFIRAD
ncbi:MAG TPA: hypothetical protein DEH24_15965 [Alteromonas sp.]|nr:hypothetical protein [Alteromonadaceae bacterium]MAX43074.1 hypothetical protein [Alteromonadaceae bacterium]HBY40921.1 hypothetical protein [Alteromonas sp.]|tara:strand:- start:249 stop:1013 length:765 start_codon:yes stop_codon:yes gene_type:complete